MRGFLRLIVPVAGSLVSSIIVAAPRHFEQQYAVCDLPVDREFAEVIAVGCQDIGSALGCRSGGDLTLKVGFTAPAGAQAKARLTVSNVSSLTLSPAPTARAGNTATFVITPGVFSVSGFSVAGTPTPVIKVSVQVAQSWLAGLQNQQGPLQRISLRFTQAAGTNLVSDITLSALYSACPTPLTSGDFVIVPGLPDRKSVALIDGERSACITREPHVGTGIITIDNLVPPSGCSPARATIFGHQRAVDFQSSTDTIWTPNTGDKLEADVRPPVVERIALWLLYANCYGGSCESAADAASLTDVAEASLNLAKDRYRSLFGGISFEGVRKLDLTNSTNSKVEAARVLYCTDPTTTHDSIEKFRKVRQLFGADPTYGKRLDVVYVRTAGGDAEWCGTHAVGGDLIPGSNMITMTLLNSPFILAHEIGHALLNSGDHADPDSGFMTGTYNNLMRPGSYTGGYLTIGQLYRMNLLRNSSLNRHGARPGGSIVDCEGFGESDECPAACFDVLRDVQPVISGGPQCASSGQ